MLLYTFYPTIEKCYENVMCLLGQQQQRKKRKKKCPRTVIAHLFTPAPVLTFFVRQTTLISGVHIDSCSFEESL